MPGKAMVAATEAMLMMLPLPPVLPGPPGRIGILLGGKTGQSPVQWIFVGEARFACEVTAAEALHNPQELMPKQVRPEP